MTLSMEWDDEVHHRRTIPDPAYHTGQMTSEQAERYRALLRKLKETIPIIERLGFSKPRVSLEA